MNVSRQAVSKWETNTSVPDTQTLPLIAEYFGVSIDYLYYGQEMTYDEIYNKVFKKVASHDQMSQSAYEDAFTIFGNAHHGISRGNLRTKDGKIIRYDLDYSDVKDDVNEEKTILEKDFEKLEKELLNVEDPEKKKLEARIKDLEFANSISRDLKDRYRRKIEAIYKIINSGKLKKNKLIREIIENEKF